MNLNHLKISTRLVMLISALSLMLALGADGFFDKATETDSLLTVVRQLATQNQMMNPSQGAPHE